MEEFKTWEEMTPLEQAQCIHWDMFKDAYGIRPRGIDTSTWSLEDFQVEFKHLSSIIEAEEIKRRESEDRASHDFETRVQMLISSGARDRAQALRWIHEAEETQGDDEYLCYTLGLPYGYFRKAA